MSARAQITIAHISDTQFGRNNAFGEHRLLPSDHALDSLALRLVEDLGFLRNEHELRPDILILSGDLSEWGMNDEFRQLERFVGRILEHLALDRTRVVMVPGNHDVNRSECEAYFAQCKARGKTPKPPYWPKLRFYTAFFRRFYRGVPGRQFSQAQMWTLFEMADLGVVAAGLNSDMAESHLEGDHYGYVGEEQARWFARKMEEYRRQGWLRVGVVHHNIIRGAVSDDENLRDADVLRTILGPQLNLLFHGHTHNGGRVHIMNGLPILSTGSAGVVVDARPPETPNQYQVVQIFPDRVKQWARAYFRYHDPPKWGGDVRVSTPRLDSVTLEQAHAFEAVHIALGRAPARGGEATADTAERPGAGGVRSILFVDHCVVDTRALEALDWSDGERLALIWHAKIQACFELIERMKANLDAYVRRHPQWEATENRSRYLAWMKSAFLDRYEALLDARGRMETRAAQDLLPALAGATPELRWQAVATFGALAALVVIRKLQAFEGYLLSDADQLVLRLFPDLPEIPDWLVELIPYRSDIGWLAFRTRGFLCCRVGPSESSCESAVLPRLEAERLQEEPDLPDHEYFRWIVPQWVLYGFACPLERRLIIWVLTDAHNRERWSRHRESPWAGEQSIDPPEGKYAGLEEVATEVELRPGWFVQVRRPPAHGA